MLSRVLASELERETNERDLRRLNDSMRSQARGLAALGRATRSLTGRNVDPRRSICEAAREAADAAVAFLLEPSGREFVSTAMSGIDLVPVTIQASGEGRAVQAFESLESYFVPDARDHPALAKALVDATDARSALFEPVVRDDAVSGVLILIWREPMGSIPESLDAVLRLIASQAAVAIEHSGLHERLGRLALTDDLTGLATRRGFDEELPREIARSRRSEDPLCLAVVDLDHMSAFNMARGEREGDRLLKESASAWAGTLREVDFIARLDGGEFGIVLPGCTLGEACEVLDRVRALTPRGQTASAGVAMWNREEPGEMLAARARDALAAAKGAGRDMTIAAD
jgi:diguanylate cyclase (GGDEF)-like protein